MKLIPLALSACMTMVYLVLADNPNCLYFNPLKNDTNTVELFSPNVCTTTRSGSTYSTYQFKCKSDSEVVGEYYGNTKSCDGTVLNSTSFKKSDGYDLNCASDAKDCSSLYRIYDSCDTNSADFTEIPLVTGMCTKLGNAKASGKWSCTSDSETFTDYIDSKDCSDSGQSVPITYKTGCDSGIYYDIITCHNG